MGNEWEGNNGNNGSAVALAEGLIEKRIRIGTKSNCKSDSAYCLATGSVHRADRSGPSDDGHQTCGVMTHKDQFFEVSKSL